MGTEFPGIRVPFPAIYLAFSPSWVLNCEIIEGGASDERNQESQKMKQRLLSGYAGDVLVAVASFVVGLFGALYFHAHWYHGWMDLFGDPPMGNSSYSKLAPLFEAAPYVAGGLAVGIIAGFGRPQAICVLIRATAPGLLYFLLFSKNAGLADRVFVPSALAAFIFSVLLSVAYFWLLGSYERPRMHVGAPQKNDY